MNWIPWPLVVGGVEIQGASWTGEWASCIFGRAAYLPQLGQCMGLPCEAQSIPTLFFSLPSPFSNSAWPGFSLWTLVLLFALLQIPDCPSLLCKHLVKTESPPAAFVAASCSL